VAFEALTPVLWCSRCARGDLRVERAGFVCEQCSAGFPVIGGLPWLFRDPQGATAEWRARLGLLLADVKSEAAQYEAALAAPGITMATRERLSLLASAYADHARRLAELLAPFDLATPAASREALQALRTRLPASQGLTNYYANAHRDFAWGEAENAASAALVDSVIDSPLTGATVAVLGSGAGRLAYDLARTKRPALMVCIDINPLLLSIAREVFAGRPLELYEFPIAPRGIGEHALLRTLKVPAPAGSSLQLVAADAVRAPLRPGAFDAVITPWFIDIVEEPLPALAARINLLLKPGGRWINFGSVAFAAGRRELQFSQEEVREIVRAQGFGELREREAVLPYMGSPASRHARQETAVAWSAAKVGEATPPAQDTVPAWLADAAMPVPLTPEFQSHAAATRIHAFVMSLIDGRRSLADIARVLTEQRLMRTGDALDAVRGFLARMHDESNRRGGY
jgi:hypothetical protein